MRRAQEWTNALTRWCEAQPQMVAFTGRCLAHRAGIMQRHGAWRNALAEAQLARERCEQAMNWAAAGQALYQQGELHRLQGESESAEAAYKEASQFGREPQPGLALLRLAQGDLDAAKAAIRRVSTRRASLSTVPLSFPRSPRSCSPPANATRPGARAVSSRSSPPVPVAPCSRRSRRTFAAPSSSAREMLRPRCPPLRDAARLWQELDAPYELARVRMLVGLACRELGDSDTAALELDAARGAFEQLGAAPDLARLGLAHAGRAARAERPRAGGSSPRRLREDEPPDRRGARRQRAHGRASPAEHLREARRLVTHRGDRVRLRAPPGLTLRLWSEMTTRLAESWRMRAMRAALPLPTVIATTKGGSHGSRNDGRQPRGLAGGLRADSRPHRAGQAGGRDLPHRRPEPERGLARDRGVGVGGRGAALLPGAVHSRAASARHRRAPPPREFWPVHNAMR